jgi:opacity protein-like surface antigen
MSGYDERETVLAQVNAITARPGPGPVSRATARVRVLLTMVVVFCAQPSLLHADWLVTFYMGDSRTASNTIVVEPADGGRFEVGPIRYETQAYQSPIYYGYRVTRFFPKRPSLGIGIEFTHDKAIADVEQLVTVNGSPPVPLNGMFQRLELSNGLNFGFVNVVGRRTVRESQGMDRLSLMAYGGVGFAIPHVETTFAGRETFEYQITGVGWQAGGGAEWHIVSGLAAVADVRVTTGRQRLDMGTGTLTGTFTSTQVDFGIGWHFR